MFDYKINLVFQFIRIVLFNLLYLSCISLPSSMKLKKNKKKNENIIEAKQELIKTHIVNSNENITLIKTNHTKDYEDEKVNNEEVNEEEIELYDVMTNERYQNCRCCRIKNKYLKYGFLITLLLLTSLDMYSIYCMQQYDYDIYGSETDKYYTSLQNCYKYNKSTSCELDEKMQIKYNNWMIIFSTLTLLIAIIIIAAGYQRRTNNN
ncbi:MAG: hypothetical protein GY830_11395 [Bacteroidetes bacterium]|nr:hypothetical protein [Bacteroidota bacterium]